MQIDPALVQDTVELVQAYIIAWMPAIISAVTAIVSVIKMFQQFKIVREEVKKNTDVQENMSLMSKTISDVSIANSADKRELVKSIADLTAAVNKIDQRVTMMEIQNEKQEN